MFAGTSHVQYSTVLVDNARRSWDKAALDCLVAERQDEMLLVVIAMAKSLIQKYRAE